VAGFDGASPPSTKAMPRTLTGRRSSPGLVLRQSLFVVLGITAAVAACVALGFGLRSVEQAVARLDLSVEGIERIAGAWGAWAPAASIALMILHSFVPFPAELIAIANGMLFGPVWGTLVTWLGAMLGAALAFALARRYGRPLVDRLVARKAWAGRTPYVPAVTRARCCLRVSCSWSPSTSSTTRPACSTSAGGASSGPPVSASCRSPSQASPSVISSRVRCGTYRSR
jgi:SNARE associated Golgi protein